MFRDEGQVLDDFGEVIYVRCPRCQHCARVARIVPEEPAKRAPLFHPRKLSCGHCGHTRTWQGRTVAQGSPFDWYFRLPLWLQTPCCGETLWALNQEHLDFLEKYVRALQRAKMGAPGPSRNGTIASRLPRWIKSAKNRDAVLRSLARLRGMLE